MLKLLGDESRLRILLALVRYGQSEALTIYRIAKMSGLDRKVIRGHLQVLAEGELVQAKMYGPVYAYRLNRDHAVASSLVELFKQAKLLDVDRSSVIGFS